MEVYKMKLSQKLLTTLSMLALFFLMLTGLASADVIRGEGWLHAEGRGVVNLL